MVSEDLKQIAIQTWEAGLHDNFKTKLPAAFFRDTKKNNNELAVEIFKYVFENIFEWSPMDVLNYLTMDHIIKFGLKKPFLALDFPPECKDRSFALYYVAILCYPELRRYYNDQTMWIMEYNRALTGNKNRIHFSDDIDEAQTKACFLLNHVLTSGIDTRFKDIEDLYAFFASPNVLPWLSRVKLGISTAGSYFLNPLQYLHESLPNDVPREYGRNDFMLMFTEFKQLNGDIPAISMREIEKQRKKELLEERKLSETKKS